MLKRLLNRDGEKQHFLMKFIKIIIIVIITIIFLRTFYFLNLYKIYNKNNTKRKKIDKFASEVNTSFTQETVCILR